MKKRAREILAMLANETHEGFDDILCAGGVCYAGDVRISRSTVDELLIHMALTRIDEQTEVYIVSGIGRSILRRPALAADILKVVGQRLPFRVVDDHVEIIDDAVRV